MIMIYFNLTHSTLFAVFSFFGMHIYFGFMKAFSVLPVLLITVWHADYGYTIFSI